MSFDVTMTWPAILAFAGGMFVIAISPGPCFFAATARAITSGFGAGASIMLGAFFGDVLYLILAIFGMAWVAEQMGDAFVWVKVAGGIFLVIMGVRLFFERPEKSLAKAGRSTGFARSLLEGALLTISNPKVLVFYASFVPAFVDMSGVTLADAAIMVAISFFVGSGIDFFYVWLAAAARKFFQSMRARRWLNRAGGTVLTGVGIALAAGR
ncbi:MAG: LysE family translocator [Pseudomonadota bacterium]